MDARGFCEGQKRAVDVCVVGAGPAGLAAAVAAAQAGADVLVIDREQYAGGVLPQCVHDGFGLHVHGASMTGPQYAREWIMRAQAAGVRCALSTTVLSVKRDAAGEFAVEAVGAAVGGHVCVRARAVVVATGCRERTRGALGIAGTRPAGVLTAGTAQYMVNVENQLPGDKVVILGSGDVGLIMARRLTLEGAQVRMVLGQAATGLLRNHVRCIEDFDVPFRCGWGVVSIHGVGQLKGVTVAPLEADGSFDMTRKEYIRCNLLLIACGLIPEREVIAGLDGVGAAQGLFVCGNALRAHDLADQVTQEGLRAGMAAAAYAGVGADGVADARSVGAAASAGAAACANAAASAGSEDADIRRILGVRVFEPKGRLGDVASACAGARLVPCTVCPTGCIVEVDAQGAVSGNACSRGADFARAELRHPMRTFTGTVKLEGGRGALLPVRSAGDVERAALLDVARACRRIVAHAPIACGDVVCEDVAHTGVALVACADVPLAGARNEQSADARDAGAAGVCSVGTCSVGARDARAARKAGA